MSKGNKSARSKQNTELAKVNILARIEQHLAILAEPTRRALMAEQQAAQADVGGEEE